jgi:serine/threonine-protein kinase
MTARQADTAATEIVRPQAAGAEPGTASPALVAGALAVVVLLVVTAIVFSNGDRKSGSGTTSTTTTTSTSSSPATTTTARSPQDDVLLAALPAVYRGVGSCEPISPDGGAVAAVRCTKQNSPWDPAKLPPAEAEFWLFGDRATQDAYFQAVVTSKGIPRIDDAGRCRPTIDPIHYTHYRRVVSTGELPGEFTTCFVGDGNAQVWWVDTRTLTIGVVKRPGDISTLDRLDLWWATTILDHL